MNTYTKLTYLLFVFPNTLSNFHNIKKIYIWKSIYPHFEILLFGACLKHLCTKKYQLASLMLLILKLNFIYILYTMFVILKLIQQSNHCSIYFNK